ncbi:MAG: 8-oxoguanine deaminase [Gammaproteobacteria bacterium]
MRLWIRNPLAILAAQADGGLVVDDGRIVELVPSGAQPATPVDRLFDAGAHVVLPGLVNMHHHFYQTLTRACPPALDKPLFPWLQTLYPIWAGLSAAQLRVASRLALVELLRSGCTTVSDHHYLFPAGLEEAIDIQVEEVRALGMRAVLTRGSMSLSQDEGGLPPRSVVQSEETILRDSERLLDAYHEAGDGVMIQIALAPCSPFSVTAGLMRDTAALARRHGARLHTHLAETADETAYCVECFGQRPVDYLESLDWLHDDVWVAHGIHFNDGEIRRLGEAGVGVCHCPASNMVLASGQCRVNELEAAGVPVGLGVDGSASNDASNLVQEVRQAFLLQRLHYGAGKVSHRDALRWATEGGARCLGRTDIGAIAVGRQADLALFRLDEPQFSGAGDPLAALLLCGAQRADRVMVAGHWQLVDGEVPGLDLGALTAEHRAAAQELIRNVSASP